MIVSKINVVIERPRGKRSAMTGINSQKESLTNFRRVRGSSLLLAHLNNSQKNSWNWFTLAESASTTIFTMYRNASFRVAINIYEQPVKFFGYIPYAFNRIFPTFEYSCVAISYTRILQTGLQGKVAGVSY